MEAIFYQQELAFLRDMAREFATAYPGVNTDALVAPGADPDVERLLQGFAFLAARVRERIEDDLPELAHTLLGMLWPQTLRPTPSMCVVEFSGSGTGFRGRKEIPAGTQLQSRPASDGSQCRFRACWSLDLQPFALTGARLDRVGDGTPTLTLSFRTLDGVVFDELFRPLTSDSRCKRSTAPPADGIRLFVHEHEASTSLVQALVRGTDRVEIRAADLERTGIGPIELKPGAVRLSALDPHYDLLADPPTAEDTMVERAVQAPRPHSALGVLRDYFVFPERYRFLDVAGLDRARGHGIRREFDLVFRFASSPDGVNRVNASNFRLGCVPAVNLFEYDARPFGVSRERAEYPLVPATDEDHGMETYAAIRVSGRRRGSGTEREFVPLYSLAHHKEAGEEGRVYYTCRVRPSIGGRTTETWLRLVDAGDAVTFPRDETVIARLLCTDGRRPVGLAPGELSEPSGNMPAGVRFQDITRFTAPLQPALGGETSWQLVSLIATNYLSLADRDNLRRLLRLMDFRSVHDKTAERRLAQRLEAIKSITVDADECLLQGRPIRGRAIEIGLMDRRFGGTPEVQLFGSVLDVVLSLFSSINSHTRLTIQALDSGDHHVWPPRHGTQILQ